MIRQFSGPTHHFQNSCASLHDCLVTFADFLQEKQQPDSRVSKKICLRGETLLIRTRLQTTQLFIISIQFLALLA